MTANIVVVANLVLDPPEVYLMPGAEVQLRLSQIRQGRAETIVLPSSQYYLEVDNAEIGTVLDASGSLRVRFHPPTFLLVSLKKNTWTSLFFFLGFYRL